MFGLSCTDLPTTRKARKRGEGNMAINTGSLASERHLDRRPGAVQGLLLAATAALLQTQLVTVVSPVLPEMQRVFQDTVGADLLVPLSITCASVSLALLSPFAGGFIDRFGRRTALMVGLVLYAVVGIMPIFLHGLMEILISRLVLGAATAVVMTSAMTLLGDLFEGKEREHYIEVNAAFSAIFAILCMASGGLLGSFGWRMVFLAYLISLILFVGILAFVWEPTHTAVGLDDASEDVKFRWSRMLALCLMGISAGMVFIAPLLFIGTLVEATGYSSPAVAGGVGAGVSLAVPFGAISFQLLRRYRYSVPSLVTFSFLIIGVGLVLVPFWTSLPGLVVGVALQQYGSGYLLAGMMIWVLRGLPRERRGMGTGMYFACFMIAQPLAGLAYVNLTYLLSGSPQVVLSCFGVLALVTVVILSILCVPCGAFARDAVSVEPAAH